MWRPNEPVEEDISHLPSNDMQSKRHRSRRRAWRDGLADQTVVRDLEDARSYRAFEHALIASVDPRSVLELALVHRLASLLWRLRRASAIETGLFEIQGEPLLAAPSPGPSQPGTPLIPTWVNGQTKSPGSDGRRHPASDQEPLPTSVGPLGPCSKARTIAQCFRGLSNLDPTLLDRLGRYEARLWRQTAQTIWTLDALRRPPPTTARRSLRKSTMTVQNFIPHNFAPLAR
jgi:hypothetical protein